VGGILCADDDMHSMRIMPRMHVRNLPQVAKSMNRFIAKGNGVRRVGVSILQIVS
jgi:hypothetical protein